MSFSLPHQIITAPTLSSAQPLRNYEHARKDTAASQRERSGALILVQGLQIQVLDQRPNESSLVVGRDQFVNRGGVGDLGTVGRMDSRCGSVLHGSSLHVKEHDLSTIYTKLTPLAG